MKKILCILAALSFCCVVFAQEDKTVTDGTADAIKNQTIIPGTMKTVKSNPKSKGTGILQDESPVSPQSSESWRLKVGDLYEGAHLLTDQEIEAGLTPAMYKKYRSGRSLALWGEGFWGYGLGFLIGYFGAGALLGNLSSSSNLAAAVVGGSSILIGIPLDIVGSSNVKTALASHNQGISNVSLSPALITTSQYSFNGCLTPMDVKPGVTLRVAF